MHTRRSSHSSPSATGAPDSGGLDRYWGRDWRSQCVRRARYRHFRRPQSERWPGRIAERRSVGPGKRSISDITWYILGKICHQVTESAILSSLLPTYRPPIYQLYLSKPLPQPSSRSQSRTCWIYNMCVAICIPFLILFLQDHWYGSPRKRGRLRTPHCFLMRQDLLYVTPIDRIFTAPSRLCYVASTC